MLAQDNKYFKEASETVYHLSKEERIRQQCWARDDYTRTMNGIKSKISERDRIISEQNQTISNLESTLSDANQHIQELKAQLAEYQSKVSSSTK